MRYVFASHCLDVDRRELRRDAELVPLEPQVFDLLTYLVQNRERVVTKDDLIAEIWGGRIVSESTLTSRINAARKAVGDSGESQRLIRTYARKGFRFVGEVRDDPGPEDVSLPQSKDEVRHAVVLDAEQAIRPTDDGSGAARLLPSYRDVIVNFIRARRGEASPSAHHGVAAVFEDATDAVRAAIDFQQELNARNAPLSEAARLLFRVGIASGPVSWDSGTLRGEAATAARMLSSAAEPGGICMSADVRGQVHGKIDVGLAEEMLLGSLPNNARAYKTANVTPSAVPSFPETRGKPSIAVLPFVNFSDDPEQEYFSDGITEDIITALAKHRSLQVVARNSTFAFKGHGTDVRRVGLDLGADYIVEGSVRRVGQRIRVTAQLVETEGGRHVWAERYDRDLRELFDVQDDITSSIAAQVEPEVGNAERQRAERKPPQTFDAWDFFRLGTKHFYRSTARDNEEAQRMFRRAIELDRELAEAYGYFSYAIVLSMIYFDAEPDENRLNEAIAIARQGVELDERDALIRFMYGRALLAGRAYREALGELESAVELNPSLAVVYCGLGDSLAYEGRFAEAIPYFQRAISLSPYDPLRWAFYAYRALAHLFAQDFEQAVEWAQKATRIPNCHYWAYAHRVAALGHLPRTDELRIAVEELMRVKPDFTCSFARRRLFYVKDQNQLSLYVEGLRRAGIPA